MILPLIKCEDCEGKGRFDVKDMKGTPNEKGLHPCATCQGHKYLIKEECKDCNGNGKIEENNTIYLCRCGANGFTTKLLPKIGDIIERRCLDCHSIVQEVDYQCMKDFGAFSIEGHGNCKCIEFTDEGGEPQCGCDFEKLKISRITINEKLLRAEVEYQ